MADIKYTVTVDDKGAVTSIRRLDEELDKLGAGARTAGKESKSFGQQLTGNLIPAFTAASIAADVIRSGFRFLKNEVRETIGAAIEAEKVDRALEAALAITGQAAGKAADHFKFYASALQRKTKYDDEAIKSAQALMIQMGLSTGVMDQATRGAIGLASVFGMDLEAAARAVAQGFEGNYRTLGMLIPAVRTATTEGEKHAAMLKGLADYYKRAESDVMTFEGKLGLVKKAYNELRETAGKLVIENKNVLESLEGIKSIIEWLDMQAQKASAEGGGKKKSILDYFGPLAVWKGFSTAIAATGKEAKKAVDDYAMSWEGLAAAIIKGRMAIDPLPIITVKTKAAITLLNTAIDAMPWGRHRAEMEVAAKQLFEITTVVEGQLPVVAGYSRAVDVAARHVALLGKEQDKLKKKNPWDELSKSVDAYAQKVTMVTSALDAIFMQSQTNREIAIENEYKRRLAWIEANITDEAARQVAIAELEAKYQIERSSAARAGAKQRKAIAMMEAVVNTASAVTEALPNLILAAIVAALGAIQIGVIAAQPIPLAKGGVFTRRTRLLADTGTAYDVAENEPEVVAPKSMIKQAVREALGMGGMVPAMAGASVTFGPGAICIYAQTLDDATIEKAGVKIFQAIRGQLRTHSKGL